MTKNHNPRTFSPPHSWRYESKCAKPEVYPEVRVGDVHFVKGQVDTELFYPPRDKALYKTIADASKAICYGRDDLGECPVRRECLLYALTLEDEVGIDERHGIYGGKSNRERAALERRRQAQHPELNIEEYVRSEHCR